MSNVVSGQAKNIYNLLALEKSLTAAEIGDKLHILPNAVYRSAKQLINLGTVERNDDYPTRFQLQPTNSAVNWYLLTARKKFIQTFPANSPVAKSSDGPTITFIKDRQTLLKITDQDTAKAKRNINFIVSGLEVPDATILAYRKAKQKGLQIRALVQRRKETSKQKLEAWKDIGVDVKYIADMGIRLFIFDSQIIYFTSYDSKSRQRAFGIRFEYRPLAEIMDNLFEEKWEQTEVI